MDDIVRAALVKWPNVPNCYGWLALDARGEWYMRDDQAQAAGPFPTPKGSRIVHDKLRAFIERNYASDERGSWFFQNGPQRVYVELEAAPFVWRLERRGGAAEPLTVTSHNGLDAQVESCWLDESGHVFLATDVGFGLVHTLDVHLAADAIEQGSLSPQEAAFDNLIERFGYRLKPAP